MRRPCSSLLDRAKATTREVWRETRHLTRDVQLRYVGAAVAVVVSTLITLAGPALVRYAIDDGITKHDRHVLDVATIAILVLAVAKPFVVRAQTLLAATGGERYLASLRTAAFDKLQALPLGFFEQERTGVLVSRLTSDVQALDEFLREALVEVVGSGLQIVLTAVVLVFLSPKLAAVSLIALPILLASSWAFHHSAGEAYHAIRDRVADTMTVLQEGLSGVRVVQSFRREQQTMETLRAAQRGADPGVAARLVREHPPVHDDPDGPDARAHDGAARRRDDVRPRRDLDRDDRGVPALPGAAVRPDRAVQRVARRVPSGPRGARQDRRPDADRERGRRAARARSSSPRRERSSCTTSRSATRAARRSCAASRYGSRSASRWRWSASPGRASPRSRSS